MYQGIPRGVVERLGSEMGTRSVKDADDKIREGESSTDTPKERKVWTVAGGVTLYEDDR